MFYFIYNGLKYSFNKKSKMINGGRFIFPFHITFAEKTMQKFIASNCPYIQEGE